MLPRDGVFKSKHWRLRQKLPMKVRILKDFGAVSDRRNYNDLDAEKDGGSSFDGEKTIRMIYFNDYEVINVILSLIHFGPKSKTNRNSN